MKPKTVFGITLGFIMGFCLLCAWHYVGDRYLFPCDVMPFKYYMIKSAIPVTFTFAMVMIVRGTKKRREEKNGEQ